MSEEPARVFVLHLKTKSDASTIRRLRLALKRLWRSHGLRCTGIEEIPSTSRETSPGEPGINERR
jgi:hypothetical protein